MMRRVLKYFAIFLGLIILTIIIIGGGFGSAGVEKINDGNPIIFAHRGVSLHAVENSRESFDLAVRFGLNAIEADVSTTADGRLIIFHDDNCSRLLNLDQEISKTRWSEIENRPLLYKGNVTKNRVLTLEQFLELQNDSEIVYLDMKELSRQIVDSLIDKIERYNDRRTLIVADANLMYLIYLKLKSPKTKVVLEGFNKGKEWLYYLLPKKFKPDYYSSFLDQVDEDHIDFLVKNDLMDRKIVYSVELGNISQAYKLGLSNIIFDFDSATCDLKEIRRLLKENRRR